MTLARAVDLCEHVDSPHYAKGMCVNCYQRLRRRDTGYYAREAKRQAARMQHAGKTEADRHREWYFRKAYGITHDEYDVLVERQNGKCAVCAGPPNGRGQRLHVDHDHATGVIRGLLCGNCNTAIGLLRDDPKLAEAVASYLTKGT